MPATPSRSMAKEPWSTWILISLPSGSRLLEEALQLVDALRGVYMLVAGDRRDGGLMHADVLGHVAQDERLEVRNPIVEVVALELQNRFGHAHDEVVPPLDRTDQPHCGRVGRFARILEDRV